MYRFILLVLCHCAYGHMIHVSERPPFIWYAIPKNCYTSILHMIHLNHIHYVHHRSPIDHKTYPNHFKFAFVRNPWERVVSAYENLIVTKRYPPFNHLFDKSFDEFVFFIASQDLQFADIHIRLQTAFLPNLKDLNFLGHFETFEQDIAYVLKQLGLQDVQMPHANKSNRAHYSCYYNNKTRAIIANKYRKDIQDLCYRFESK